MTRQRKPNGKSWTLRQYFDEVFLPQKMAGGWISGKGSRIYAYAINLVAEFAGREVPIHEIDTPMMDRFSAWLIGKGYKARTSRNYSATIRGIVRHRYPDAFPTEGSGSGQMPIGLVDADIEGTLEHIFVSDYLPSKTSISSQATIRQYGRCLRLFSVFLGHPAEPRHLTDKTVGKFLRWLVEVEGVKAITANGYVKQVKALWTWLAKKRIVEMFPTVEKLKEPEPTPVAWTEDELQQLMSACRECVGFVGPVLANLFWVAFHCVLFDTGERTGAMLELKWQWLDWKSGHLTVPGEFRKGRVKAMVYKLKPATVKALRAIAKPQRERIFELGHNGPLNPESFSQVFYPKYKSLVKGAGLPWVPRQSGPQKMRRSFASHIEAAGGNATKALKHRDRRVTEDSYLDPRIVEVESENAKLFSLDAVEA